MKQALKKIFWVLVLLGFCGAILDFCDKAEATEVTFIRSVDDTARCWQGDCVIYLHNGVVRQECKTFCNFYCYWSNYSIVCDGQECYNNADLFCHVDGGPHCPAGSINGQPFQCIR